MSALGITAQIPNFIMSIINMSQIIGGSLMIRIAGPLTANCINVAIILALVIFQGSFRRWSAMHWFYIVSLVIVMVMNACNGLYQVRRLSLLGSTMHWFYIVSLVIVMVMNACNGLYQNSVFGLVADFPANYTNALVVGTNICGTFTSLLSIITTVAFPSNYKTVALIYFSISLATLVLCGVSLIYVTRLKFYKFYVRKGELSRIAEHSTRPSLRQFYETFKGVRITILLNSFAAVYDVGSRGPQGTEKSFPCWMQLLSIFLVFFVTLSVFPTILAGTTPNRKGEPWNSAISKDLYPGLTTFLNFNLFAAIGSSTANFIQFVSSCLAVYLLGRLARQCT
ncbi:nucleoside transporter [Cooperia oncophora]